MVYFLKPQASNILSEEFFVLAQVYDKNFGEQVLVKLEAIRMDFFTNRKILAVPIDYIKRKNLDFLHKLKILTINILNKKIKIIKEIQSGLCFIDL